jgi:hypothetical protein
MNGCKTLQLDAIGMHQGVANGRTQRILSQKKEEEATCGRYVRRSDKQKIAEWFHADDKYSDLPIPDADYNVAPTTFSPSCRKTGRRDNVR